jgi:acyl carrier protein
MLQKIEKIIFESINDLNETLSNKIDITDKKNIFIYGDNGVIDSIGLISLIVDIEYKIEEIFHLSITLANEKSISQKNSPFKTICTLSKYIKNLILEAKNEQ